MFGTKPCESDLFTCTHAVIKENRCALNYLLKGFVCTLEVNSLVDPQRWVWGGGVIGNRGEKTT